MTPEQITVLIGTIVGAPFLIELVKRWFDGRNLNLQSSHETSKKREDREWQALEEALTRERSIYADFLVQRQTEWNARLNTVEAKLAIIQEESARYQKLYWEERVQRERLQARVEYLEQQLQERDLHDGNVA